MEPAEAVGRGGGGRGGEGGGGGASGGKRGGPCWEGLQLPLVLANHPLAAPALLPIFGKKRGPKSGFGSGGRIWRGVPVLTTYTPSARGLGGLDFLVPFGRLLAGISDMWPVAAALGQGGLKASSKPRNRAP